jgi:hypothetical protein
VSPSELAAELDAPLGDVSYHTRRLLEFGCVELVHSEPGRGGVRHSYRAVIQFEIDDAQWLRLAPAVRGSLAEPVLRRIWNDATAAAAAGALEADDLHLSWVPLELDAASWSRLSELLRNVVQEALRLNEQSERTPVGERTTNRSFLALLHLQSAPGSP